MSKRFYCGVAPGHIREVFTASKTPTEKSHGHKYAYVIGGFKTEDAARFMAFHGEGNPHLQCVADAERIVKEIKEKEQENV